jgi:Domain of unknown function (DUF4185)
LIQEAIVPQAWGWIALVPLLIESGPPVVKSAAQAPELDALFECADGWIGADGAYSVALSPNRTLWLFSDTWVGRIRDGQRTDPTIVNNTVGVQEGYGRRLTYSIARGPNGKPTALVVPADGGGWFWIQAGVACQGELSLFLNQVEKTDDNSVFGFRSIGLWLGTVANAEQPPEHWRVQQVKMPNTVFSHDRTLAWGAATLRVHDDLYVYGIDERRGKGDLNRQMVLARVPAESIRDLAAWRYFRDGLWGEDFHNPSPLAGGIACEYSVTPFGDGYLAVYTESGLSPRIMGRTAAHPWGPWSAATVLYECPEMSCDKKVFCYAAKAHPSLSSGNDVVVSYVVNSFDFRQVARDAKLYWPRFVRVTLKH